MKFTFTIDTDHLNDSAAPEIAIEDLKLLFKFLCGANPNYYMIGGMLSDQLEKQLKELSLKDRELIIDYLDNPDAPDPAEKLKELCNVNTDYVICQVTNHKSYANNTYYEMTDEFYDWLNDKIQCEDCKNGGQIYKDKDGYYFCITGSNYYDKETDKYKGTDEVHIRIKPFDWIKED